MTSKGEKNKGIFKKANGKKHLVLLIYGNCLVCFAFRGRADWEYNVWSPTKCGAQGGGQGSL